MGDKILHIIAFTIGHGVLSNFKMQVAQSLRSHQFIQFEVTAHETFKNQRVILHTKSIEIVKVKIISCQVKPLGPQRPKMTW